MQSKQDNSRPPGSETAFACMSDDQKKELWSALALKHTAGLGLCKTGLLLKKFGSAYAAIQNPEAWSSLGIRKTAVDYFKSGQWRAKAGKEWAEAKMPGLSILLWTNPYYPPLLREIPDPPLFLYFKGKIELFCTPSIGVIGARHASSEALAASRRIAGALSGAGITVVSGMAKGVDSEAHRGALSKPGSTIAVLGCGLNHYYPLENRLLQEEICQSGLVISEYPPKTGPERYRFPCRNRLISALTLGILVVEASERSGSLITARQALEYGREVFALPGKFAASASHGSHKLIRNGAVPVFEIDDLLLELLPRLKTYAAFTPPKLQFEKNSKADTSIEKRSKGAAAAAPVLLNTEDTSDAKAAAKNNAAAPALPAAEERKGTEIFGAVPSRPSASPLLTAAPPAKDKKQLVPASGCTEPGAGKLKISDQTAHGCTNDLPDRIIALLKMHGALQGDSICALLGMSAEKVSSELAMLELSGQITRYPGMIYALD